MRRLITLCAATMVALFLTAGTTLACGGLIGPNGAVNLLRTTTFAGYHDGIEHYVTAFKYAGGGGAFGSLIPLPGIPTDVVKGGDWTLQRLIRETDPPNPEALRFAGAAAASDEAQVIMTRKIDALDITVLKGGADEVGTWAKNHGFRLPADAPEVLDFYARRSPIFLAAAFDPSRAEARDQQVGDGTPVHITIPTDNPWVPLRILALGKTGNEQVQADVYLLTDHRPALLPGRHTAGLNITHNAPASDSLLSDLRSDRGMEWVPSAGWLTKLAIDARAADLRYDLAVDTTGADKPSFVAAGFTMPGVKPVEEPVDVVGIALGVGIIALGLVFILGLTAGRPRGSRLVP